MSTIIISEEELLKKVFPSPENLFFIQIGSNDGITLDPIHQFIKKYAWRGILVEPVHYLFEKLQKTYEAQEGLCFENIAIDEKDGERRLYQLKENDDPEVPFWYNLLASFKEDVLYKHKEGIPGFDKYVFAEDVKCMSFRSLLDKHQVERIDLLHIDTEGYDYEIIKQVPFGELKPTMILFEHVHLSEDDFTACKQLLTDNHYTLTHFETDTLAVDDRRSQGRLSVNQAIQHKKHK
nr:FkbM family methyltransferase [uncultured Chitinophaga sp.]